MLRYFAVVVVSVTLSVLSQVLLKKSSSEKKKSFISEYLNTKVMLAYGTLFVCMILTIYALTGIDFKYLKVIGSLSHLLGMIFGAVFLKEKITRLRILGNAVIILGIFIFFADAFINI